MVYHESIEFGDVIVKETVLAILKSKKKRKKVTASLLKWLAMSSDEPIPVIW